MKKNKTKTMLMILIVSASAASAGISYPPILMPEGGVAGGKPATRNTYNDGPNQRVYTVWEAAFAGSETPAQEPEDPFAWLDETTGVLTQVGTLNGPLTGSLIWAKENVPAYILIGPNARVTGNLYYPGTPTITFVGSQAASLTGQIIPLSGSTTPSGYAVNIAANARINGNIYTRATPPALPSVPVPPPATATTDLVVSTKNVVVPSNRRNVTVTANASAFLPSGTYKTLALTSGTVTLGAPGSAVPLVYNFESLNLTGAAKIVLVGPVIIRLKNGVTIPASAVLGEAAHPEWLTLAVSSGGVTAAANSSLYGSVVAPTGTVALSGTFNGGVSANSTVLNGLGINFSLPPPVATAY